jgi:hypothetical protein
VTETPSKTTSVLLFRPRAGDDGKEMACRAENKHFLGGMLEDRKRLDVACKWLIYMRQMLSYSRTLHSFCWNSHTFPISWPSFYISISQSTHTSSITVAQLVCPLFCSEPYQSHKVLRSKVAYRVTHLTNTRNVPGS